MSEYTETRHGLTIRIERDEDNVNPRTEWDNFGTMVCFHRRYNLGDKHSMTREDLIALVQRPDVIALPLFLLDHSGLMMKTGRFESDSAGWDTSFVGYIYVTHETVREEFGKLTKENMKKALEILEAEVAVFSAYLEGEVYGFIIENESGERIESCWGFIETEYPIEKSYVLAEARNMVDSLTGNGTTDSNGQIILHLTEA